MLSGKSINQILEGAEIAEGNRSISFEVAHAPKSERLRLLRTRKNSNETRIAAAIEIQRYYRGYCTRCRLLKTLNPTLSKTAVYSESKLPITRLDDVRTPTPCKSATRKQSGTEKYSPLEKSYNESADEVLAAGLPLVSLEEFCTRIIQTWWRKLLSRKSDQTSSSPASTSKRKLTINAKPLSHPKPQTKTPSKPKRRLVPLLESEAATIIQRAWRRHIDIQVYRYYRDLVNFRQRGDPAVMLKCINPIESKLLDAAAGVSIKFRLAGDRFPPNIYYKIFTHRPIQDICANAPRDYTDWDSKRKMARDVHNKGNRQPKEYTDNWYQRIENNGWRLVSDRLIYHIATDPVTWQTSKKKMVFHHNKIVRKDDVEKRKKRKKIEWMRKMYKQGMLKAKAEDKETVELIEGAAAGMVATIDKHGEGALEEWEVDELLDWTTSLNFQDYWSNWKELATSADSENSIENKLNWRRSSSDPYEFAVRRKDSNNEQSARPSHNTPVSNFSIGSLV